MIAFGTLSKETGLTKFLWYPFKQANTSFFHSSYTLATIPSITFSTSSIFKTLLNRLLTLPKENLTDSFYFPWMILIIC